MRSATILDMGRVTVGLYTALVLGLALYVYFPRPTVVSTIIVPHHDLVKPQRESFLQSLSSRMQQPETIILISPNHYESGRANIQLSEQTWRLSNGVLDPNRPIITQAEAAGAQAEPSSFDNEHGIRLILPDIKRYFPKARVVPIIFKRDTTIAELTKLNAALSSCRDCVLMASVDFSHYQPTQLSNLHDDFTIRALDANDTSTLMATAETDSPAALGLVSLWAKNHDTLKFNLANHTNSGTILNKPNVETTSHLFAWYGKGEPVKPADSVSFIVGGDMMFGRGIAHAFPGSNLPLVLSNLGERVFWGTDAALINLEGPISATPVADNPDPNNLNFNFPPNTIAALKFLHVNASSNANNHSLNAGQVGLDTTRALLKKANVQPVGGPSAGDVKLTAKFSGQNLNLYVVGVDLIKEAADPAFLIHELKADPRNRVLVFAHWGSEYATRHDPAQTEAAHAWIDAGADIVVGSHPHVLQDGEVYKGRPIVYSLGNLLFDQINTPEQQQGMLVAGEFNNTTLRLFVLPTQTINLKPQITAEPLRQTLADRLYNSFGPAVTQTASGKELKFNLK